MNKDIHDLIDLYLTDSDALSAEQIQQLSDWIRADASHQRLYIRAAVFHRALHDHVSTQDLSRQLKDLEQGDDEGFDSAAFQKEYTQLLQMEQEAPTVPASALEPEPETTPPPSVKQTKTLAPKLWLSIALSTAALLLILLGLSFILARQPRPVATLSDTHEARWQSAPGTMNKGKRLWDKQRKPFALAEGFAKVQFDNGATVHLEGPLEFLIQSDNSLLLNHGRLCARVSNEVELFRVNTHLYDIIDLGTEFGVEVTRDGSLTVQMYDGKAALVKHGTKNAPPQAVITQNQARKIDTRGVIHPTTIKPHTIVRQFSSSAELIWRGESIDLADIVGGGNGLGTGKLHWGVHTTTGQIELGVIRESHAAGNRYVPVPESEFIDGVFLPVDSNNLIISSLGHRFDACPRSEGSCPGYIVSGRYGQNTPPHSLDGIPVGIPGRSVIFFHPNQGITFDLAPIRTSMRGLHPELMIPRFTARTGISDREVLPKAGQSPPTQWVDVTVLIDGELRFQRLQMKPETPAIDIDITLKETDRFLTMIVTQSDDTTENDWLLIAEPTLEVAY